MRLVATWWSGLSLRWRLVALNAGVVAAAGITVLFLVHHVDSPSVATLMHQAQTAPTRQMAQQAYDTAVDHQVIPAVAVSAFVAILLNFVVVSLALRPLAAVRRTARRITYGDLTARTNAANRDEIGEVARSVDDMAAHLQRLEDLRRQVTDDVSHELRTPLHNILGLTEGMRDGVLSSDAASLDRMHAEVMRLIALVDDVRLLADAQTARDHLRRDVFPVAALARDVVRGFEAQLAARRLEATVILDGGLDVMVDADPARVAQVLRNLLSNAVRHATEESVIEVALKRVGGRVRIEVHNQGDDIPSAVIPFIFERFVRADRSRGRDRGGAGIGLSIVKELVEAHGGSVGATSAEGHVVVWFELPIDVGGRPGDRAVRRVPSPGVA